MVKTLTLFAALVVLWGCEPSPEAKLENAREHQTKVDQLKKQKADIERGVCRQAPSDPMCNDAKPH